MTGARFLREPFRRNVVNLRAGYDEEMMHLINYLVKERSTRKIAYFFQDDSFGKEGLASVGKALAAHGLTLAARGSYQRNTVAVLAGMRTIQAAAPQAVVLVAPHAPSAEFIKLAVARGMDDTVFCTLSFSGVLALNTSVGPLAQDIVISQVMPFPWKADLPIVQEYQKAVSTYRPRTRIDYSSLEGYLAGRLFCHVAAAVKGPLTREGFLDTLEGLGRFDLGGIPLSFGPDDHQGMDQTFLLLIRNGLITPIDPGGITP
jgi:ABC-type branched-subunit amino acid transport system substrate-binding protein